jgi:hypothetical protein
MSRPRTGPAQSRARSNSNSVKITPDPLAEAPRFDDDGEEVVPADPDIEMPHRTLALSTLNDSLWWTGFKVGIGDREGKPSIIVVWEGPDIVRRFFEWKRE